MDKIALFHNIAELLFKEKRHYYESLADFYIRKKLMSDTEKNYIFKGIVRTFLNTYEYICMMYVKGLIDDILFEDAFGGDIINLYESNFGEIAGIDITDESTEVFKQIRLAYAKIKEKL